MEQWIKGELWRRLVEETSVGRRLVGGAALLWILGPKSRGEPGMPALVRQVRVVSIFEDRRVLRRRFPCYTTGTESQGGNSSLWR